MNEGRVARVTEIIAASNKGFDDAIKTGFKRATQTLRDITGIKIIEQRIAVNKEQIAEYRVRMEVIFVLDD